MKQVKLNATGLEAQVLYRILLGKNGSKIDATLVAVIKQFQTSKKLSADGIVGPKTWAAIAADAPLIKRGDKDPKWVAAWQIFIDTDVDGSFGPKTLEKTKAFQSVNKLSVDGKVGPLTWGAAFGLAIKNETVTDTPATTVTNKQPVNYKQGDSRWGKVVYTKNNTYNKSQTISNSGCGPTAVADIVATWWDSKVTPKEMAALSVANGYRTTNSGTAWGFFKFVANKYGASKFVQTGTYATAEAAIKSGAYVVVSVGPGVWTKGGHFICWWKVDDKYVYINDPASSASARAKSAKSNLKNQAKQYFIFYK